MKKGSVVRVELTGRELASLKVFETTSMETAKNSGIFRENQKYGPITVVLGTGELLKALEEALMEMSAGQSKKIVLSPEKAFGERKPELTGIVPLQEFKNRNIQPFPGMVVELNERAGRVQSVSGGRVRVDFNQELAGKTVEFDLKIVQELAKKEEKIQALVEKFFPFAGKQASWEQKKEVLEIMLPFLPAKEIGLLKQLCAQAALAAVDELKEIRFAESFKREQEKKEEKPKT